MSLIKLRKANETGDEVGVTFINPDQILEVCGGENTTQIQMTDGRTRWVKNAVDEVVTLAKAAT